MAGIAAFLKTLLQREGITSPADLQWFMARRSAFIAQKCVIEYCRARAGLNWQRLFSEKPFQEAVHVAAWQAWQVTLLDVVEMVDALLRPHAADVAALHAGLRGIGEEIITQELRRAPLPARLPGDFAGNTRQRLQALLNELADRAPLPVKDIARARSGEVFAAIPIHPDLKAPDEDYVFNTLRVYLVRAAEDLQQAAELEALARKVVRVGA